jgi:hypothetical protein
LKSWTEKDDPGIQHFSGIATYRTTFTCPDAGTDDGLAATLDLGRVAEVCEVRLNGKLAGGRCHPPYCFDVSRQIRTGENRLEIRVANLWHNRIVGDAALPKARRVSRMVPESHYKRMRGQEAAQPLIMSRVAASGLLGPVRIRFAHK